VPGGDQGLPRLRVFVHGKQLTDLYQVIQRQVPSPVPDGALVHMPWRYS
jgi:hypothetical protein